MSHPLKASRLEIALIYHLGHMAAMYEPDVHANLKDDVPVLVVTHQGRTRNLTVGHIREAHEAYHALTDGQQPGNIDSAGMKEAIRITWTGGQHG